MLVWGDMMDGQSGRIRWWIHPNGACVANTRTLFHGRMQQEISQAMLTSWWLYDNLAAVML